MSDNWSGKRVLIIGAARQGLALARYLSRHSAQVTVNDKKDGGQLSQVRQTLENQGIRCVFGSHPAELLEKSDLVCVSGGVPLELPLLVEARRLGIPLSNDSQIFMEAVPCPVIGITGSAGKTTTTTLVGRMAQIGVRSPGKAWVGGNIGQPLIESVDQMQSSDLVVMELSSFQLELMTISPQVAAVLNVTPNHLDRHGTMEAYTAAKARILDFQTSDDYAVLGREDAGAWGLSDRVKGLLVTFGINHIPTAMAGTYLQNDRIMFCDCDNSQVVMSRSSIQLRGEHNLINVLAACAIAFTAGIPVASMRAGVEGFTGVPHRLQLVRSWHGADWYNDSIATAPERTIADIRSFTEPLVLLLGGRDKKLPWDDLAAIIHDRVDHLVVFGEAAPLILKAVGQANQGRRPFSVKVCGGLQEAVQAAAQVTEPGDVVLLAPGGTSFDEFTDFEERGERFIQWVKELS